MVPPNQKVENQKLNELITKIKNITPTQKELLIEYFINEKTVKHILF